MTEQIPSWEMLRRSCDFIDFNEFHVPDEARKSFYIAMGEYIHSGVHGLWLEPDSRDGHCNPGNLSVTIGERFAGMSSAYNGEIIKSPIENMLFGAMLWLDMDWAGMPGVDPDGILFDGRKKGSIEGAACWITPQAHIGSYRADFVLWFKCNKASGGIVIECDGHAFHERTKEQATRDKKRDREILGTGYPVVRFTGSEIFKNPSACAEQIAEIASDVLDRVSREGGLFK